MAPLLTCSLGGSQATIAVYAGGGAGRRNGLHVVTQGQIPIISVCDIIVNEFVWKKVPVVKGTIFLDSLLHYSVFLFF